MFSYSTDAPGEWTEADCLVTSDVRIHGDVRFYSVTASPTAEAPVPNSSKLPPSQVVLRLHPERCERNSAMLSVLLHQQRQLARKSAILLGTINIRNEHLAFGFRRLRRIPFSLDVGSIVLPTGSRLNTTHSRWSVRGFHKASSACSRPFASMASALNPLRRSGSPFHIKR